MHFPTVFGAYVPEPLADSSFNAIAAAADAEMVAVLHEDLGSLDLDDAELVSYDEILDAVVL